MRYVIPFFCLFACVSCGTNRLPVRSVGTNDSLGGAYVYVDSAQRGVKRAMPHTSKIGEPILVAAGEDLEGAKVKLNESRKGLVELQEDHGKLLLEGARKDWSLNAYRDRWVGDKTYRYLFRVSLVVVLTTIGLFVARVWGGGWVFKLAGGLLHFLPVPAVPAADKLRKALGR